MITEAQRIARRNSMGSSDAAPACRVGPWGDPLSIYLDKLGVLPDRSSPSLDWGNILEPIIAKAYELQTGATLYDPQRQFAHADHPWMTANLDRVSHDRIVEIKTASLRYSSEWGAPGSDEVPDSYLLQVQHQMAVSGQGLADIAVLIDNGDFRIYTVKRSEPIIKAIIAIEGALWQRIQRREPPEPDWANPQTAELLDLLHRPDPTVTVELGFPAGIYADKSQQLAKVVTKLEAEREEARARLIGMMGTAGIGLLEDGRRVQRKQYRRKGSEKMTTELRILPPLRERKGKR